MNAKQLVEWQLAEETKVLGETPTKYPIFPPKLPNKLPWDQTRAGLVVGNCLLTAWATERSWTSVRLIVGVPYCLRERWRRSLSLAVPLVLFIWSWRYNSAGNLSSLVWAFSIVPLETALVNSQVFARRVTFFLALLWSLEFVTAHIFVWGSNRYLTTVLHSSVRDGACYITRRQGYGSSDPGGTLRTGVHLTIKLWIKASGHPNSEMYLQKATCRNATC
jgi:hypothetical protein